MQIENNTHRKTDANTKTNAYRKYRCKHETTNANSKYKCKIGESSQVSQGQAVGSLALFIIPGGIFASANSQTEIDILL